MRLRFAVLLFSALLLPFVPPASAQNSAPAPSSTIRGTLTDPSDAVVADALITVQSLTSSASAQARSGADGSFSVALAPGRYRVSIAQPSFGKVEQEFSLAARETRTWDVRLELATMSSNVIVTAQAEPTEASNVVAPVDVITRQDIDDRGEIWLTPMLAAAPGASFSQLGPMGGVTSYFLDGGDSNYTKVLVDGVPVNEPGGAIDFSNFTTDAVDKIEVVHGASSALYGSDAMDGVMQIFTHRGTTPTPRLVLEADGGTFGTGRGSGQLSGVLGAFDYSLDAGYFSSAGQSSPPVMGEAATDYFRDTTLSGNFGWKLSDTDSLRLTVRNSASDAGQPGQTLYEDNPFVGSFAVDPGQHNGLHDFSSGLTWNFSNGGHWQNELSGYDSRFADTEVSPPFSPFVSKFNRAGLTEQTTYSFTNGGVTAGYWFEVENGGAQARHNQAGYIEARYRFRRRLSVVAGGRVEANGFFGTRAVPRLGASYALRYGHGFWGPTRLRASYGEGIKEPELLPADCTPILKPEQSTTFDAGIDQYFASDRVRFSLTYFHNDFRDIVSFASVADISMANCPAFGGNFFNTDKARAYGANSTLGVKATRWLNFTANYGYDDSLVLASPNATDPALIPGNRLLKRPLNSGNAMLNARWRGASWYLGAYYVGSQTDSDFLGLGITRDPGYFLLNTAATLPLRYGLAATAYFGNLLDRHYQVAAGYPALGYNYRFGLRYTWGGE
ncbi:MAG TPA: TonB-dependent receptor [Candidatus Baltobacteraceae bacterium]|nr:TonB-dependent receptor [Candidatus Baltobacteraceae bacterium]